MHKAGGLHSPWLSSESQCYNRGGGISRSSGATHNSRPGRHVCGLSLSATLQQSIDVPFLVSVAFCRGVCTACASIGVPASAATRVSEIERAVKGAWCYILKTSCHLADKGSERMQYCRRGSWDCLVAPVAGCFEHHRRCAVWHTEHV